MESSDSGLSPQGERLSAKITHSNDEFSVGKHQNIDKNIQSTSITDLLPQKRPLQESNDQGPSPKRAAIDNSLIEVTNYLPAFRLCEDNLSKEVRYLFTYFILEMNNLSIYSI